MINDLTINGKYTGKIIINNMEFSKILSRHVSRSNNSSGKVNVPVGFIGKEVMVCLPKESNAPQKRRKQRKMK